MAKQQWKPGNMLYPLPAVMVSVRDLEENDIAVLRPTIPKIITL